MSSDYYSFDYENLPINVDAEPTPLMLIDFAKLETILKDIAYFHNEHYIVDVAESRYTLIKINRSNQLVPQHKPKTMQDFAVFITDWLQHYKKKI